MSYPVNIGEAAQAAGLTAKMIRDYEAVGLNPQASRTENGCRQHTKRDVDKLRFIRQARERRQRPMPARTRGEAPSYVGLAAWSRALNGGFAAQHA